MIVWVKLATEAVTWSSWLWKHRQDFEPVFKKIGEVGDFAQAALTNPDGALRRIGNTLIFGQPDGGQQVLAFLEQTTPRIESIERAVDGLQAGQAALSGSLASLQSLSMVTLGLTALTPVVLGVQFFALNRRLGILQKQLADLHKKFTAAIVADLRTGLHLLREGQDFLGVQDRTNARDRLGNALSPCIRSMNYFSELLGDELNQRKVQRDEVRLLARHLAVAVVGVASCPVGLEQDKHAFEQSGPQLDLLRKAARWVFHETVARDPAPYLLPAMRAHGVTIDFMARLYQQARDGGALDPAEDASASAWFEEHRDKLFQVRQPWLGSKGWCQTLRAELQEAVAAVEETNRVIGLSRLIEQVRGSGQTTLAVMESFKQNTAGQDAEACPYMAWGLA